MTPDAAQPIHHLQPLSSCDIFLPLSLHANLSGDARCLAAAVWFRHWVPVAQTSRCLWFHAPQLPVWHPDPREQGQSGKGRCWFLDSALFCASSLRHKHDSGPKEDALTSGCCRNDEKCSIAGQRLHKPGDVASSRQP